MLISASFRGFVSFVNCQLPYRTIPIGNLEKERKYLKIAYIYDIDKTDKTPFYTPYGPPSEVLSGRPHGSPRMGAVIRTLRCDDNTSHYGIADRYFTRCGPRSRPLYSAAQNAVGTSPIDLVCSGARNSREYIETLLQLPNFSQRAKSVVSGATGRVQARGRGGMEGTCA
jgi:hypothetical protein